MPFAHAQNGQLRTFQVASARGCWKQEWHKAFALLDPHHLVIATLRKGISVVDIRLGTTADLSFEAAPELRGMEDVVTTPDGSIYGITRNAGIVRMRYTDGTLTDIAVFEPSERGNYQSAVADDDGTLWTFRHGRLGAFRPEGQFLHPVRRTGWHAQPRR